MDSFGVDDGAMSVRILVGDCRERMAEIPDESVHCSVTSPPYYGLRDYGVDGQLGHEESPDAYVAGLVEVFREVRRVLRDDGTLWLNLGDSYAGSGGSGNQFGQLEKDGFNKYKQGSRPRDIGLKPKDLIGIPWRVAFALQADGWYLRSDIIWHKPNPMPESVRDRPTSAHEHLFLLAKSPTYFYDADAIREDFADERMGNPGKYERTTQAAKGANNDRGDTGFLNNGAGWNEDGVRSGRNRRNVWTVATKPYSEAHFAVYPPDLIEPCILAGCPEGGTVLDPFGGAGTTGLVADRLDRNAVLIELNPEYATMAERRIRGDAPMFVDVETEQRRSTMQGSHLDPTALEILPPMRGLSTTERGDDQ